MEEEYTEPEFRQAIMDAQAAGRPVIALLQDTDGNWRGTMNKFGRDIFVRDVGPETVLQLLLTHDGSK